MFLMERPYFLCEKYILSYRKYNLFINKYQVFAFITSVVVFMASLCSDEIVFGSCFLLANVVMPYDFYLFFVIKNRTKIIG